MTLFKFLAQIRFLTLAVLLVMILMRLVWMDLRVYDVQIDSRFFASLSAITEANGGCEVRDPTAFSPSSEAASAESFPSWQNSPVYHYFVQLSCRDGYFSQDSYVRMNQGLLVLTILFCILICRMYCRSWVMFLAVAALLLSRGRYIAANGTISGQMLTSLLVTLWCLTLFHYLRTGSRLGFLGQVCALLVLLWVEVSLWPIAWAFALAVGLSYLARGRLLRPLLERMRQTQMRERWYAKALGSEPTSNELWNIGKFGQNLKRLLGLVRPTDWAYQPLSRKFRGGTLLRPLQVPFLLWVYHGKFWTLQVKKGLLTGLVALFFMVLWAWSLGPVEFPGARSFAFWETAWPKTLLQGIDLDIAIVLLIFVVAIVLGPAAGLVGYWESTLVLFLTLALAAFGVWIWDAMNYDLTLGDEIHLWRANSMVLWFEPVLLSFGALGLYNLLRVVDRAMFHGER